MQHGLIAVVVIAAAFGVQFCIQRGLTSRFDYQCGKCGQTFQLTPLGASLAPHRMGGGKFVRCPFCGARSWAPPVPKDSGYGG